MRSRILFAALALATISLAIPRLAWCETLRFADGATDTAAPRRCGKNIANWTAVSALTLADAATTLTLDGKSFGVDRIATSGDVQIYMFDTSPTHTVSISIDPFRCADASCAAYRVAYAVTLHPDAPASAWNDSNTCTETWKGTARHGK
jgi:hypothetical protein